MNLTNLIRLNAIIALAFGIALLFSFPGVESGILSFYDFTPPGENMYAKLMFHQDHPTLLPFVRFFGATSIALGIALWALGDLAKQKQAQRGIALVLAMASAGFLTLLLPFWKVTEDYNTACWLTVAVPSILAAGYAYFALIKPNVHSAIPE